jgi:ketosteroid isomerase-like protein
MINQPKEIVEEMFSAFATSDLERFKKTVSDDTVWIYHGTHKIPKARFEGKEGASRFISNILTSTEIIKFEPQQFVTEGNTVVVIGEEHQKVKRTGEELKQRWVQVYTTENNLITRMEEFAATE